MLNYTENCTLRQELGAEEAGWSVVGRPGFRSDPAIISLITQDRATHMREFCPH